MLNEVLLHPTVTLAHVLYNRGSPVQARKQVQPAVLPCARQSSVLTRTEVALHSALINSAAPSQMTSAHNRLILFVEVIRVFFDKLRKTQMHSAAKCRIYLTLKQVVRVASTVPYVRVASTAPYVRGASTMLFGFRGLC